MPTDAISEEVAAEDNLIELVHMLEELLRRMLEQEGTVDEIMGRFRHMMEVLIPGSYPKAVFQKPVPCLLTDVKWEDLSPDEQEWLLRRKKMTPYNASTLLQAD